mgnify:CR=1 FL=1
MDKAPFSHERTSRSHPLEIAEITARPGFGRIGITFCPGKQQSDAFSGSWDRDLDIDLSAIAEWGACAVVTLAEMQELRVLRVENLGRAVREHHMDWFHLPIRDVSTPDEAFEQTWIEAGPNLRSRLRQGFDIVIHCKGGLGRAGTIAARLLVEFGWDAVEAIRNVREARPGAIETAQQEAWIRRQSPVREKRPSQNATDILSRARGAMIGLAVGDALGTTLEFAPRDVDPLLTDIIGGGPFNLNPGEWTDDTSMALALAESLAICGQVDEHDLMGRFLAWRDEGAYSSNGYCFDIGATVNAALERWIDTSNPVAGSTDPDAAGNGSLMRLAPVAIRFWDNASALNDAAARQSRTTHGASEAVDACIIYARMISAAIRGRPLDELLRLPGKGLSDRISAIVAGSWRGKRRSDIQASGYVVHSLEAALWSIGRTGNFAEAVLVAANLGEDADTTAAITGQLAGALYGEDDIPASWRQRIVGYDRIIDLTDKLLER